ncbi:MAG: NHL repeat-containing protein [Terriglobia bacterium]
MTIAGCTLTVVQAGTNSAPVYPSHQIPGCPAVPGSVTIDSNGNVYVVDTGSSWLYRMTPGGGLTQFVEMPSGVTGGDVAGIAANANGNLYVALPADKVVALYDPSAKPPWTKISSKDFVSPTGLALDSGGNLYIVDTKALWELAPSSSTPSLVSDDSNGPVAVAVDVRGAVYVGDADGVWEWNGEKLVNLVPNKPVGACGLAVDGQMNLYLITTPAGTDSQPQIECVSTYSQNHPSPAGISKPTGIAVDPQGNLYAAATSPSGSSSLFEFSLGYFCLGLPNPAPIVVSAAGVGQISAQLVTASSDLAGAPVTVSSNENWLEATATATAANQCPQIVNINLSLACQPSNSLSPRNGVMILLTSEFPLEQNGVSVLYSATQRVEHSSPGSDSVEFKVFPGNTPLLDDLVAAGDQPWLQNPHVHAITRFQGWASGRVTWSFPRTDLLSPRMGNISVPALGISIPVTQQGLTGTHLRLSVGQGQSVGTEQTLSPLIVSLQDSFRNPVEGVTIIFSPVAGPSGAGIQSPGATQAVTDANGLASSPPMQTNSSPGSFSVMAYPLGDMSDWVSFDLRISSKFMHIAPSVPWSLSQSPSLASGAVIGDIDGDGRCEFVSPSGSCTLNSNLLGVFSFFRYGDLLDAWLLDPGSVVTQASYSSIPGYQGIASWTLSPSDQYFAADLDGDGAIEILAVNITVYPGGYSAQVGVLKWTLVTPTDISPCYSLQTIYNAPMPSAIPPFLEAGFANLGPQSLAGSSGDVIVVWNAVNSSTAGLLYWNGTAVEGLSTTVTIPTNASFWNTLPSANPVPFAVAAQLVSASPKSLVVFEALGAYTAYQWDDTSQSLVSQGNSSILSNILAPFWACGDFDGDGLDEIVGASASSADPLGSSLQLSLLDWAGDALSYASLSTSNIPNFGSNWSPMSPTIPVATAILPIAAFAAGQAALLIEFGGYLYTCSVSSGESGAELNVVASQSALPAMTQSSQAWTVGTSDQILPVDLDGDGFQEIVLFDGQSYVAMAKYDAATSQLGVMWLAYSVISGWTPNLVASAPQTPFTTFTGVQGEIYAYVSVQATQTQSWVGTNDIRSEYTNGSQPYETWASNCHGMTNPGYYDHADWKAVTLTLYSELSEVYSCWTMFNDQQNVITPLLSQQNTDATHVVANLSAPLPAASSTDYWMNNVVDALLWGLAAAPIGPELQIPLAIFASIYPAVATAAEGSGPTSVSFGTTGLIALLNQISSDLSSQSSAVAGELTAVVTDPNMMSVMSVLLATVWTTTSDAWTALAGATSVPNQIMFCQQLIPVAFQVWEWGNPSMTEPYYCMTHSNYRSTANSLGAPTCSYAVQPDMIKCLCSGDSLDTIGFLEEGPYAYLTTPTSLSIPPTSPTGLGLNMACIFQGTNGWNLQAGPPPFTTDCAPWP